MSEFDILGAAAAGMDAQRSALELAARNVAAAQTTSGKSAFERMVPHFAVAALSPEAEPDGFAFAPPDDPSTDLDDPEAALPVQYLGASPERGVDVDAVTEMVAILDAQRAYEANASVFDLGKQLAERTIELGRL